LLNATRTGHSRIRQRIAELPANADRKDKFRIRCEEAERARAELQRVHDDSLVAIKSVMQQADTPALAAPFTKPTNGSSAVFS
jgi:hypothetical protein